MPDCEGEIRKNITEGETRKKYYRARESRE